MADFVHELDIAASPDSLRKLIAERGDAWWTTNALIDSARHTEFEGFGIDHLFAGDFKHDFRAPLPDGLGLRA